jgi:hypothetical protein
VSIYGDAILLGTADSLVALDGPALLREAVTGNYKTGEGHAHPPLIADGKKPSARRAAILGTRQVRAYDAANGTRLWTFYTAPQGRPA